MQTEILIAGFGGQGVLFAGQVLAYAAMDAGYEVTWFPSYGPEMRGGTANCTVIIADEEIGSPLVSHPKVLMALNAPSLDKFEPQVQPEGLIIANASLLNRGVERSDLDAIVLKASHIAEDLSDRRLANMVMLGALMPRFPMLTMEQIKTALKDHLPASKHHLLEANYRALDAGAAMAEAQAAA